MRSMIAGALAAISILCPARLNALVTGCAVVQQPPNGISNLHKAPTINSEVVAQLKRRDFLFVDTARCETGGSLSICDRGYPRQWTHVTSVRRIDGKQPRKTTRVGQAIYMFDGSAVKSIDEHRRLTSTVAAVIDLGVAKQW